MINHHNIDKIVTKYFISCIFVGFTSLHMNFYFILFIVVNDTVFYCAKHAIDGYIVKVLIIIIYRISGSFKFIYLFIQFNLSNYFTSTTTPPPTFGRYFLRYEQGCRGDVSATPVKEK